MRAGTLMVSCLRYLSAIVWAGDKTGSALRRAISQNRGLGAVNSHVLSASSSVSTSENMLKSAGNTVPWRFVGDEGGSFFMNVCTRAPRETIVKKS